MKGLYRYLSPFAPDQSGAVSVFFELGGIIVICDAGGCAGNICGFDEPRWFTQKSALFSAGIRDMDAIMGRDDRLMGKISDAVSQIPCNFIALIGTPVPAVIGTDFKALSHIAEKRFGLPVLTVETTGMDHYDRGQEKAYLALFKEFALSNADNAPDIGIIGATPLDLFDTKSGVRIAACLQDLGYGRAVCYGMGSGLDDIKKAGAARCNLVVSPSGLKAAKWLKETFGTPYVTGIPLTERSARALKAKIDAALEGREPEESGADINSGRGGLLIIHQQFIANELRKELRAMRCGGRIDAASWFILEDKFAQNGDAVLREENDLPQLLKKRGYRAVAGDPIFRRAIAGWNGDYIDLPHYPVSSGIYGETDTEKLLNELKRGCSDSI